MVVFTALVLAATVVVIVCQNNQDATRDSNNAFPCVNISVVMVVTVMGKGFNEYRAVVSQEGCDSKTDNTSREKQQGLGLSV